jgi:hypothetical protein
MLTEVFGTAAAALLVVTYALEARSAWYVLGFAAACIGVAAYAVATDAWLFAALEGLWALIALRRWRLRVTDAAGGSA